MHNARAAVAPACAHSRVYTRTGWIAALTAFLLLVLAFWLRARGEAVAVLIIEENDGQILAGPPAEPPEPRLILHTSAGLDQPDSLLVDGPGLLPKGDTRVYTYQAIYSGLDLVEDRFWQSTALPEAVIIGSPLGSPRRAVPEQPEKREQPEGVQVREALRLVPAEVTIQRLDRDGRLELLIRGSEVALAPGDQWVEGRVRHNGLEQVLADGSWETEVSSALERGEPLTVLRIHYLGRFPLGVFRSK